MPLAIGLVLARAARVPARPWPAAGDAIVAIIMWAAASLATLRPFGAAVLVCSLLIFIAVADRLKRSILREPALFADGSELLQVFTHPRFYVPFAGAWVVYGISGVLALAAATALAMEKPPVSGWEALACSAGAVAACMMIWRIYAAPPRLLTAWVAARITRDPWRDTARLGTVGAMAAHSFIARAERPARQEAALNHFGIIRTGNCLPPLLVVQAESFFDPRRLSPAIRRDILPNFDKLRDHAAHHGLLGTPAWGGYTMRTEFLTLTGLSPADLGLDMTNPYHAFARRRIDSLAWRLRAAGYRTICMHPFDRAFYRRDVVLPLLGFEHFLGIEYFGGGGSPGGTVSDEALAVAINRLIANSTEPLFIFAITIANHGPWGRRADNRETAAGPENDPALAHYIDGCRATDRMIGALAGAPWCSRDGAVFAFYGDHMPILSGPFRTHRFNDARPDYTVCRAGTKPGTRRDIEAGMLPRMISGLISADARNIHFTDGGGTGIAAYANGVTAAMHAPVVEALNE